MKDQALDEKRLDHCSEVGARALADRVRSYWQTRGYHGIRVNVVRAPGIGPRRAGDKPIFAVVSNLDSFGFPPRE